ncbi:MAG: NUDIX domain-containing protein [Parvibaculum sp.]|uniref:NUDIX hydrolase n=1 Tax=Parvibaculum sp. TaxID=2024848 RepID=UPI0025F36778|nr:NUDIX domain-containing protein [Parvibaculum sp.]MCE9648689.1 NUDIX domain-containing protein [Parvibaculum sp.]
MQTRKTARALLFDKQGRLLLVQMHDPNVAAANGEVVKEAYWVTIGGEIDPGEDISAAALREITEETGHKAVRLGPPVWYVEHVLNVKGAPRLFQETFVIAFTEEETLSAAAWTEDERRVIKNLKWWDADELYASRDTFFPTSLKENLLPIFDGVYPQTVLRIEP